MIIQYEHPRRFLRFGDENSTTLSKNLGDSHNLSPYGPTSGKLNACGVYSARNVLSYFDVHDIDLGSYFDPHSLPPFLQFIADGHWLYPSEVRSGLDRALAANGYPEVNVALHHSKRQDDVVALLRRGYPVIALVDNGSHYVTVVRYEFGSGFWVHDNATLALRPSLDLSFSGATLGYSKVSSTSFRPGTLVCLESANKRAESNGTNLVYYNRRIGEHALWYLPVRGHQDWADAIAEAARADAGATSGEQYEGRLADHTEWLLVKGVCRIDLWNDIETSARCDAFAM